MSTRTQDVSGEIGGKQSQGASVYEMPRGPGALPSDRHVRAPRAQAARVAARQARIVVAPLRMYGPREKRSPKEPAACTEVVRSTAALSSSTLA